MSDDGHYAFLPKTTVCSQELNALPFSARWLYIIMVAERHGVDQPFALPYKEIATVTGMTRPTISRAIKALAGAGFLQYEHGGLECNPNVYELESDWLEL